MSKRAANGEGHGDLPLKDRERPDQMDVDDDATKEMGEFEDEFEDEFESEDEIIEAGVDGRPDAEREAEEKESMFAPQISACVATLCRPSLSRVQLGESQLPIALRGLC